MSENRIYAAGIVKNEKWAWQGTVIAPNKKRALQLMSDFKKKQGMDGRCEVDCFFNFQTGYRTSCQEGVSSNMNIPFR